jgi:hypothetical protein
MTSAAPTDVEPSEELIALEDEPVASAAPIDVEPSEGLVALEAGAVASADVSEQDQAELPALLMPDLPIQDFSAGNDSTAITATPDVPAMLDGSAPVMDGTALAAHPPQSPNGSVPKPRSGRGSRRQQSATEPTVKPSPKRRSSGSKRKQIT